MNLGSEENLQQFEGEVLRDIINPIENYEVVRYIHEPYDFQSGLQQSDIWYYFYFLSGNTYVQDYSPVDISYQENELLLKQTTNSFFRLEFYKTPGVVTNNVLVCEPPTAKVDMSTEADVFTAPIMSSLLAVRVMSLD